MKRREMRRWFAISGSALLAVFCSGLTAQAEIIQCPRTIELTSENLIKTVPAGWVIKTPRQKAFTQIIYSGIYEERPEDFNVLLPDRDYYMPGFGQGISVWWNIEYGNKGSWFGCAFGGLIVARRPLPGTIECWSSIDSSSSAPSDRIDCRRAPISSIARRLAWRGIKLRQRDGMGEFAAAGFTPKIFTPARP